MKISLNGRLVDIEGAPCTPSGWLIGVGIFETLRTVNGAAYAVSRHMQRAIKSASIAHVTLPQIDLVTAAVEELLLAEQFKHGLLRISFDQSGQWAAVHLPYDPITTAAKVGVHLQPLISEGETIKSYPYENRLAILKQARTLGFDEAIVSNSKGNICEGAVTNLLLEIDGRWSTPPTSDGVLPGIMRGLIIDYFQVRVASVALSRIGEITGAFMLSSLRIAQPVASIQGRTLAISKAFNDEIHAMAVLDWLG